MIFLRPALIVGALPITLLNGTTADATQVMSDLNWIVNQVNANAAPLATAALINANNNFTTVQSGQPAIQPANFPIASQIQNNSLQTLSSVLGTNTITARVAALPLGAYVSGQVFTFYPSNANTGAATVNIDGLGARSLLNMGSGLSGAELQTYRPAVVAFNNAVNAFDLINGTPYVQGPNLNAAATLNLDGTFGDYNQVDGTTNITALTLSRGRQKLLEFNSSPMLSHSATLILGTNLTPSPGDVFSFRGEAGGAVRLASRLPVNVVTKKMTRTVLTSDSGLYVPPVGCTHYDAQVQGDGGGGWGSTVSNGANGTGTTFGAITAGGGGGASSNGIVGGVGGTAAGGDINIVGGSGGGGAGNGVGQLGASGAGSPFGGAGGGGGSTTGNGVNAAANSGSGGGGGASSGGGGGSGGYVRKVFAPATPQSWSIGAGGAGGAGGTRVGGNGGSGIIIVDEFYS